MYFNRDFVWLGVRERHSWDVCCSLRCDISHATLCACSPNIRIQCETNMVVFYFHIQVCSVPFLVWSFTWTLFHIRTTNHHRKCQITICTTSARIPLITILPIKRTEWIVFVIEICCVHVSLNVFFLFDKQTSLSFLRAVFTVIQLKFIDFIR